jgi:hypothetical protein
MMWKLSELTVAVSALILATGCSSPKLQGAGGDTDGSGSRHVSIAYLKEMYTGVPVVIDRELYIEGQIISSDAYGQFYHKIVIEDDTGGIAVNAAIDNYFKTYWHGRTLRVNCNSLTLGSNGGAAELGSESYDQRYQTGYIPAERLPSVFISMSGSGLPLCPTMQELGELSERYVHCLVGFNDVQFADEEQGLAWCDWDNETEHYITTNRHIANNRGDTLTVRTSGYAKFAQVQLPIYSGYIEGILEIFNREYQLVLVRETDAVMESERF